MSAPWYMISFAPSKFMSELTMPGEKEPRCLVIFSASIRAE
jgi:hypothetical protein